MCCGHLRGSAPSPVWGTPGRFWATPLGCPSSCWSPCFRALGLTSNEILIRTKVEKKNKKKNKRQKPIRRQNLQMLSSRRVCSTHLPCGETPRWPPSASSPVQWTDERKEKKKELLSNSPVVLASFISLYSHTRRHARAHHVGDSAALQVDVQLGFRSNFLSLLLKRGQGEGTRPHVNSVPKGDGKLTRSSTAQAFCLTWSLFFSCSSSRFIFCKEEKWQNSKSKGQKKMSKL